MSTTVSKDFTLEEFLRSDTATAQHIDNTPATEHVCNLCALVHHIIQPLRTAMQEPVTIGSGYRSPQLNKAVGGAVNSQHMSGQAADLCIHGDMTRGRRWFSWIKAHCIFDQLIWEHNAKGSYWVHVSYRSDGRNRMQVVEDLLKK